MMEPPILGCRPVDLTEMIKAEPEAAKLTLYPGSVVGRCEICSIEVYIGPKMQEVKELIPSAVVGCIPCALKLAETGHVATLINLGNTFKPKEK